MNENPFSDLPQVDRLLCHPSIIPFFPQLSRPLVAGIVAGVLEERRGIMRAGGGRAPSVEDLAGAVVAACLTLSRRRLRRIVNGTGVILHTNMGRSPLPREVWRAAEEVNTGYSNLELELESGKRGKRSGLIPLLARELLGCEGAIVVNNNAAAVLLMLAALARGKEVLVSRGEQVQIGGGFRIPEILALSGARLVEVGTTNVTTTEDYLEAIGENTAMVLLVHTSNFALRGFTKKPEIRELAARLPAHVVLAVDQGSGCTTERLTGETPVARYFEAGAKLVCFSADKLLGGPQAGIVAGDSGLLSRLSSHPLMRAFRPGKSLYSLLEEFLVRKLNGDLKGRAETLLSMPREVLERFGREIGEGLPPGTWRMVDIPLASGGGSAPDESRPSPAMELIFEGKAERLLRSLRELTLPIIGTISEGAVRLSLATMFGEETEGLSAGIASALAAADESSRQDGSGCR